MLESPPSSDSRVHPTILLLRLSRRQRERERLHARERNLRWELNHDGNLGEICGREEWRVESGESGEETKSYGVKIRLGEAVGISLYLGFFTLSVGSGPPVLFFPNPRPYREAEFSR